VIDARGDLPRRGDRRWRAELVFAAQQSDGAPQLAHAAPAHLLGRSERILGRGRVAAQDVPRARDLEHHCCQPVSHEVVDVARDPSPFLEHGLVGELAPRRLELRGQPSLPRNGKADHLPPWLYE
jgi:hypothetical protein